MQGRREVRYQQGVSRCLASSTYVGREWRPANSVTAQFFVPSAAHGHRALLQRDDGLHNSSRICTGRMSSTGYSTLGSGIVSCATRAAARVVC